MSALSQTNWVTFLIQTNKEWISHLFILNSICLHRFVANTNNQTPKILLRDWLWANHSTSPSKTLYYYIIYKSKKEINILIINLFNSITLLFLYLTYLLTKYFQMQSINHPSSVFSFFTSHFSNFLTFSINLERVSLRLSVWETDVFVVYLIFLFMFSLVSFILTYLFT